MVAKRRHTIVYSRNISFSVFLLKNTVNSQHRLLQAWIHSTRLRQIAEMCSAGTLATVSSLATAERKLPSPSMRFGERPLQ